MRYELSHNLAFIDVDPLTQARWFARKFVRTDRRHRAIYGELRAIDGTPILGKVIKKSGEIVVRHLKGANDPVQDRPDQI
ncbi:MAG TPA: hypothetical protein VL973_11695, partial [Sphingomonas sp.]|nr:hypothetical protein [Sphingomonas sp.]